MEKQLTFPFLVLLVQFLFREVQFIQKRFDTWLNPVGNYLFKVNNRNNRTKCEICSKLTPCSSVSIVNFEHVIASCVVSAFENNS